MPEAIEKGGGVTPSERILADLGQNAFLDLWSYPNPFIDKKQKDKGAGKELCDLLVVCGNDIIICSDKAIAWQKDKPVEVAWPRFYRKAISASVDQINGAARWITAYPNRIFTDSLCTLPLPVALPPAVSARLHGVVVAGGAYGACQKQMNDDSGSFMIAPRLKGHSAHVDFSQPGFIPFTIGDPNPDGMFVHVFDPQGIRRLLEHLDTITDFTQYLNKREAYLRSDKLFLAHGEEELLAAYLNVGIRTGKYDFETKRTMKCKNAQLVTAQGSWSEYLFSERGFAKTLADEPSYAWDKLIGLFTDNVIAGESISLLGYKADTKSSERALRFMAMESRFARRALGEAITDAYQIALTAKQDRFVRTILPTNVSADRELAYVFMILAYPTDLEAAGGLKGGYDQYRAVRTAMLQAYCYVLLHENRNLRTAVGIAIDASPEQTGRRGGSEDLVAVQINSWTAEMVADVEKAKEHYDILRTTRLKKTQTTSHEYPLLTEVSAKRREIFETS